MCCGCPAGTHGCDLFSKVRLDQSANPVVCGWVQVLRVVRSSWSRGAFVHLCLHSHTPLRPGRGRELAESGIITDAHPPRPRRHSSDSDVHRHLTSTLRSWWIRCHAVIVVLTASAARHHRLLTLHFHWHVNNLVARIGPMESLARSVFGHVHVLATESHGYQVDSSCFDPSPVVPSRSRTKLNKITLISSTLSSFNSLLAS